MLFMGLLNGVKNVTMPSFVPETYLELAQKHKVGISNVFGYLFTVLVASNHTWVNSIEGLSGC